MPAAERNRRRFHRFSGIAPAECAWLVAAMLFSLALRVPFFNVAMIADEGGYAYATRGWLDGTGQLYGDLWISRPQGIFLVYAAIFKTLGTGTVATAVLFSSAFPAMFGTFVKYQFQRTYDAILAAPVDTEELVTAEALWIATRAGVYGCVPMLVAVVFGLDPAWGMLLVPFIGWIAGFGWANFGISIAGYSKSFENFNYVISAVLTPLFLLAGSFFPLDGAPGWLQAVSKAMPLRYLVDSMRDVMVRGKDAASALPTIGGLLLATFATLFFVPVVYSRLRRKAPVQHEEAEAHLLQES